MVPLLHQFTVLFWSQLKEHPTFAVIDAVFKSLLGLQIDQSVSATGHLGQLVRILKQESAYLTLRSAVIHDDFPEGLLLLK